MSCYIKLVKIVWPRDFKQRAKPPSSSKPILKGLTP